MDSVEKATEKMNIFDIFAYILPGMILLSMAYICIPDLMRDYVRQFGVGKYVLFFMFSYFYGVVLHELGNAADRKFVLKCLYKSMPRDHYLDDENKVLRTPVTRRIAKVVYEEVVNELDPRIKSGFKNEIKEEGSSNKEYPDYMQHLVFSLCVNYLELHGYNTKADKFTTLSEFGRSMCIGLPITTVFVVAVRWLTNSSFPPCFWRFILIAFILILCLLFGRMKKTYEQFRYSTIMRTYYLATHPVCKESKKQGMDRRYMGSVIARIRTCGQTGVDRAALDSARKHNIEICGWCPKDGWAEDFTEAPGIMAAYSELKETSAVETWQCMLWNMRDADSILMIIPEGTEMSGEVDFTVQVGSRLRKPMFTARSTEDVTGIVAWLRSLATDWTGGIELFVGGPRASECAEAYRVTEEILGKVFEELKG